VNCFLWVLLVFCLYVVDAFWLPCCIFVDLLQTHTHIKIIRNLRVGIPQQDIHEDATEKPKSIDHVQAKHQTHPHKAIHDALRRRQLLLIFNYRNIILYFIFYISKFAVLILFYILSNHDIYLIHTYSTDPLNI
jgi:hypothetical protein